MNRFPAKWARGMGISRDAGDDPIDPGQPVIDEQIQLLVSAGVISHTVNLVLAAFSQPLESLRALVAAGTADESVRLLDAAIALELPVELSAKLRCLLAETLILTGRAEDGWAMAGQLAEDSAVPDSVASAATVSRLLGLYVQKSELAREEATAFMDDETDSAVRRGAAPAALTVLSNLAWADGDLRTGLDLARRGAAGSDLVPSPLWRPHLRLELAAKLTDLGAFDEAERELVRVEDEVRRPGAAGLVPGAAAARIRLLVSTGRLAEAQAAAADGLRTAAEAEDRLFTPQILALAGLAALYSGDLDGAAAYARRMVRESADYPAYPSVEYDWLDLQVAEATEGPRRAVQLMRSRYTSSRAKWALFTREPGAAAWFVRTALAGGEAALAAEAAATATRLSADNPGFGTLEVAAAHSRGLLHDGADDLIRAASEHRHHWARTCAAEDLIAVLGRRTPVRAPVPSPCEDASPHPANELTGAEYRIACLVSEGLTNHQVAAKLYLSHHTVNYHLRSIFKKLGVGSRTALARRLHVQSLPPACGFASAPRAN